MKLLNRPPKLELSKSERERLTAAAREIDNINRRFAEIAALRQTLRDAAADFVAGRLPIRETLALGSFSRVSHEAAEGEMRKALKRRTRELIDGNTDLIRRHHQHAVELAEARANEAERLERKAAHDLGIADEDFRPSGALERLKAEAAIASDAIHEDGWEYRAHDLSNLLAAAGIATPTTSAVTDDDDD
jgi:DNA repair exonuclease SbcCD ATPase subunit